MLAVNTWAAVAGMLVVGFLIAYAGVGGPRVVGAANGLQLLYILPSFPPYQPDALGSRLIGLILAVGLLTIADRVPGRRPYRRHFVIGWPRPSTRSRDRLVALRESDGDRHAPAESDVQGAIALPAAFHPSKTDRSGQTRPSSHAGGDPHPRHGGPSGRVG